MAIEPVLGPNRIQHRIKSEVEKTIAVLKGGDRSDLRLLSWLRESLTDHRVVELKISRPTASESGLFWLVTDPANEASWYIVYDAQSDGFGLAGLVTEIERDSDTETIWANTFLGSYGSLVNAVRSL